MLDSAVTATTHHHRISVAPGIQDALQKRHFAQVDGASYRLADDLALAQRRLLREWDHLEPDDYLRDDASFRRRRFALFYFDPGSDEFLPLPANSSYLQAANIISYAGGINRHFAPLSPTAIRNEFLHELVALLFRQLPIGPERRAHPWLVDIHQIRIIATSQEAGEPAPEGPHRDGEEFGVVQLVNRQNVAGGLTTVYSNDEEPLLSWTLREPLDTLLLWDPHVLHGVSPIRPVNPDEPGIRDTLLIGYDPRPLLPRP